MFFFFFFFFFLPLFFSPFLHSPKKNAFSLSTRSPVFFHSISRNLEK